MQQRILARFGRRLAAGFLLVALPSLALATFSAQAWGTLSFPLPRVEAGTMAQAAVPVGEATTVLSQWSDTQTTNPITINLVQQARNESAALNNAVRSLRAQIVQQSQQNASAFSIAFLLQSLNLISAERNSWDGTWRLIGVPHADQTFVQNRLINLQVSYVNANALLISFQGSEIAVGSISTFTPPAF